MVKLHAHEPDADGTTGPESAPMLDHLFLDTQRRLFAERVLARYQPTAYAPYRWVISIIPDTDLPADLT